MGVLDEAKFFERGGWGSTYPKTARSFQVQRLALTIAMIDLLTGLQSAGQGSIIVCKSASLDTMDAKSRTFLERRALSERYFRLSTPLQMRCALTEVES